MIMHRRNWPTIQHLMTQSSSSEATPAVPAPKLIAVSSLSFLGDFKPVAFKNGSGRRELAEAIASRNNPLTARVWVNRIWDQLLGRGIVDTQATSAVAELHPRTRNSSTPWPATSWTTTGPPEQIIRRDRPLKHLPPGERQPRRLRRSRSR